MNRFHIDCELAYDVIQQSLFVSTLDVPFATFFGSTRLRRLSPLVERASGEETLPALQTANAGIVLSPEGVRSSHGA